MSLGRMHLPKTGEAKHVALPIASQASFSVSYSTRPISFKLFVKWVKMFLLLEWHRKFFRLHRENI